MIDCCAGGHAYEEEFSRDFARSTARRYLRRGLSTVAGRMVTFLESRGVEGASVLEIGGGVGYLCVELLRRGAATATNLDLSPNYEEDASDLVARYGLAGRLARLNLDIAQEPGAVPPADIVVLNRVVCCYPDYAGLLSAAGGHARSLLVMSYPTANPLTAFWSSASGTAPGFRRACPCRSVAPARSSPPPWSSGRDWRTVARLRRSTPRRP